MTNLLKSLAAVLATLRWRWGHQAQIISGVVLAIGTLAFTFHTPGSAPLAPVPTWQQVIPLGAEVSALALADDGDVYLAGTFEDTLHLGKARLTSVGATDIFITRFDVATSTFSWAQQAGGAGDDVIRSLAINHNKVYLAGYAGRAGAGPAAVARFDTITLVAQGTTSMFVAKLEEQGDRAQFRWVQGMSDVRASEVQQMAVKNENIFLAGSMEGNDVHFGIDRYKDGKALPRDSTRYHHVMYVARMSDAGADVKGASMLIIGFDRHHIFTGLVADAYPDIYLSGSFEKDPATFIRRPTDKPGTGKTTHLEAQVHKFADENNKLMPIWEYTLGDSSETTVNALAVKGDRLYAAGTFQKSTHFKDIRLTAAATASYLACLTSSEYAAEPVWAVSLASSAGRVARCQATALALHDSAVYVAGRCEIASLPKAVHQAAVGEVPKRLASGSSPGIFVSHILDTGAEGRVRWQQTAASSSKARVSSLVVKSGLVHVAGSSASAVQFGRFKLSSSKAPQRAATGFWAELGPAKKNGQ